MKVLIKGLGSIAERHIQNIKILRPDSRIAVWRHHSQNEDIGELKSAIESLFFNREDALKWQPNVTFITDPAPFHMDTALIFAQQGSHLFIEKPLDTTLSDVDLLLQRCQERKLALMVGYVLRFLKPLKIIKQALLEECVGKVLFVRSTVGQYLCDWRPLTDYRTTVSAQKKLGGGVLFELSHELDYLRWMIGEVQSVNALNFKLSDLDVDVEDTAEILLKFHSGVIGSVHLDMIDRAANRSCRIVGTKGTLLWSAEDHHTVKLYRAEKKEWIKLYSDPKMDSNEMYLEELKHFFSCIEKGADPLVTGEEGKKVLELILAAKQSVQEGREVFL